MLNINQDHPIFIFSQLIVASFSIIGPILLFLNKKILKPINELKEMVTLYSDEVSEIKDVVKELQPNHGGSIKDKVNRISSEVSSINDTINYIKSLSMSQLDLIDSPVFQTDNKGRTIFINDAYKDIFETSFSNIKGNGWMSLVHEEDFDSYIEKWEECLKYKRDIVFNSRFVTLITKRIIHCKVSWRIIVGEKDEIVYIIGKIAPTFIEGDSIKIKG